MKLRCSSNLIITRGLLCLTILVIVSNQSCRTDFEYEPSAGNLRFSKDTVYLDTIFTNIGSSTYTLKVYNDSNKDVAIPLIKLKTENSGFRLNVDGLAGTEFTNIPLLAKDSLFVFVETTYTETTLPTLEFLLEDAIEFHGTQTTQEVVVVSLIRDAEFLFPKTNAQGIKESIVLGTDLNNNEVSVEGFYLNDNQLTFTNTKPYVIYGYAGVQDAKELVIDAGARVHFHKNSGLLIENGGSLTVNGAISQDTLALESQVIFEGDRLEPEFETVAGQWGAVWFRPGSIGNLNNLTIKNASIGILAEGAPALNNSNFLLNGVQIYNSSSANLWAITNTLTAQNSVFGNAGQTSVYLNLGGQYTFTHCTIANYWRSSFRNTPALLIDNEVEINDNLVLSEDLIQADFKNTIIDGNGGVEFLALPNETNVFEFELSHCSIQFQTSSELLLNNPLFDFDNNPRYQNCLVNPNIAYTNSQNHDFRLTDDQNLLNVGNVETALEVPLDILGNSRTANPTIGAYQLTNKLVSNVFFM